MKLKKRNILKIAIIVLVMIEITSLFLMGKALSNKEISLEEVKLINNGNGMYAIMLENDEGEYDNETSTSWPSSEEYTYNSEKSGCIDTAGNAVENVLTYSNNKLNIKTNKKIYCYLYFNQIPVDIKISLNTVPTDKGLGYKKEITCDGTTSANWDDKYNRLLIGSVSQESTKCTLTYTKDSSDYTTNYLNEYIINNSVEGTIDGTNQESGEIVHEIGEVPDFSQAVPLTEEEYGTVSIYQTSGTSTNSSTSGTEITDTDIFTFDGTNWTNTPDNMTSSTTDWYHIKFNIPSDGYYQICYDMSTGSTSNKVYAYINTTNQSLGGSTYLSAATSSAKSGCQVLGYLTTSNYIHIANNVYDTKATFTFSLQKTNVIDEFDAGYRYEGKAPSNYIWFNNELWRIIGVFDTETSSGTTQKLTKIIRNEPIGNLVLHTSTPNNWASTALFTWLNNYYLNNKSYECYGYYVGSKVKNECDYTKIGLGGTSSYYGKMMQVVVWNLGGLSTLVTDENYMNGLISSIYKYERSTIVYGSNSSATNAIVGLMYPSDILYSVPVTSTINRRSLSTAFSYAFLAYSWMSNYHSEWLLTHVSNNISMGISTFSPYTSVNVRYGNLVRPVVYLKNDVYIKSGSGSATDPYIIGM